MKKEENEMARVGDEVKPRQDGDRNQLDGSKKGTFWNLRTDKKELVVGYRQRRVSCQDGGGFAV
jgi:hypothetical protein